MYVRSLNANLTPSTTEAMWKDWPRIVEICFENREADIGRFLRRHLVNPSPEALGQMLSLVQASKNVPTPQELVLQVLDEGRSRFEVKTENEAIPSHGSWETALVVLGKAPEHTTTQTFLRLIDSSNPRYTGWPVWLVLLGGESQSQPYVFENAWESLIVSHNLPAQKIDFWRIDPRGRFYLRRPFEDDMEYPRRYPIPLMTVFDIFLMILRVAEAIGVGIEFAKALGYDVEETTLIFGFRWSGLANRTLSSWSSPGKLWLRNRVSYQNEVLSIVSIPLGTPKSAISEYVAKAIRPLSAVFDGLEIEDRTVEELALDVLDRR